MLKHLVENKNYNNCVDISIILYKKIYRNNKNIIHHAA